MGAVFFWGSGSTARLPDISLKLGFIVDPCASRALTRNAVHQCRKKCKEVPSRNKSGL